MEHQLLLVEVAHVVVNDWDFDAFAALNLFVNLQTFFVVFLRLSDLSAAKRSITQAAINFGSANAVFSGSHYDDRKRPLIKSHWILKLSLDSVQVAHSVEDHCILDAFLFEKFISDSCASLKVNFGLFEVSVTEFDLGKHQENIGHFDSFSILVFLQLYIPLITLNTLLLIAFIFSFSQDVALEPQDDRIEGQFFFRKTINNFPSLFDFAIFKVKQYCVFFLHIDSFPFIKQRMIASLDSFFDHCQFVIDLSVFIVLFKLVSCGFYIMGFEVIFLE